MGYLRLFIDNLVLDIHLVPVKDPGQKYLTGLIKSSNNYYIWLPYLRLKVAVK